MILKKSDIFNKNSICIFTDASYTNIDNSNSVCSGACVYCKDLLIDQTFTIMHNSPLWTVELCIMVNVWSIKRSLQYTQAPEHTLLLLSIFV